MFFVSKKSKKRFVTIAFFEAPKKFAFSVKVNCPSNFQDLIDIIKYAENQLDEIRALLLRKNLLIKEICFAANLKNNATLTNPSFLIKGMPKVI